MRGGVLSGVGVGALSGFLALLVSGCAASNAAQGASVEDVVGCYQFRWTPETSELGLPWGFELLAEPLEGWGNIPDGHVARTRTTERIARDHPFAYWRNAAADTVQVGHPGGGGFFLALRPDGRDLVGVARPVGDVLSPGEPPGPRPARPVTALRVLCPPPAVPGPANP